MLYVSKKQMDINDDIYKVRNDYEINESLCELLFHFEDRCKVDENTTQLKQSDVDGLRSIRSLIDKLYGGRRGLIEYRKDMVRRQTKV
jgi:hypothetical protein